MAPYIQTACDCGYRFSGSERLYKTCPHCGALNPSTRILCDCGHFVLSKQSKLTTSDVENAYNSGRVDGMMEERNRNAAEWKKFFEDACLKNTITGGPIQSLEDFRQWKKQFDAAKADREQTAKKEQARIESKPKEFHSDFPSQKPDSSIDIGLIEPLEDSVANLVISCAAHLVLGIKDRLQADASTLSIYIATSSVCAWSGIMLHQNHYLTQYIFSSLLSGDYSPNEFDPETRQKLENLMWHMYNSIRDTLPSVSIASSSNNPFVIFISKLQDFLQVSPRKESDLRMLRIMKDFSTEYMHSLTVDEVSKAVPRPPMQGRDSMIDSGPFPLPAWSTLHWNVLMYKNPPFPDSKKSRSRKKKNPVRRVR